MLVIEPIGGLANRMRVIVSALNVARKLHRCLGCVWVENSELNAPFEALFEKNPEITFIPKLVKYDYLKSNNNANGFKKIAVKIINKVLGFDYCLKQSDFAHDLNIYNIVRNNKRVYIRTCEEFSDYNNGDFLFFSPNKNLLNTIQYNTIQYNTIQYNTIQYNTKTIGIHIRRNDNLLSIEHSPLRLFIEKIDEIIKKEEQSLFYLSTDDITVEKQLIERYKERIIVNRDKDLSRNTVKGVQDAVIDMFCLAATSVIYGSYWSSFSDVSARIGHIKCITVKKQ